MRFRSLRPTRTRSTQTTPSYRQGHRLGSTSPRSSQLERLEERILLSLVPPSLHSLPGAPANLYLDFVGSAPFAWGGTIAHGAGPTSTPIPAFTMDADANNFSALELTTIQNIFKIVAEKFSPFNIDVTTVDPGNRTHGVTVTDVIGGSNSDWYQASPPAGGVSQVGSFTNSGFVNAIFDWTGDLDWTNSLTFSTDFAGGNTIPHEAGHAFGLNHERSLPPPNTITYYNGDATRSPIMGNSANGPNQNKRGIWWLTNMESGQQSPDPIQDELSIISNGTNGFGYRADDHSYINSTVLNANPDGSIGPGTGVIENTADVDPFEFRAIGSSGTFTISSTLSAAGGGMLSPSGRLIDANTFSPISYSLSVSGTTATLSTTAMVPGHDYYIEVRSAGNYGDIGQYTVSGSPQGFAALNGNTLNIYGYGDNANNITISLSGGIYSLTDTALGGTATQTFVANQVVNIQVNLGNGTDILNYGVGNVSLLAPATITMGFGQSACGGRQHRQRPKLLRRVRHSDRTGGRASRHCVVRCHC